MLNHLKTAAQKRKFTVACYFSISQSMSYSGSFQLTPLFPYLKNIESVSLDQRILNETNC